MKNQIRKEKKLRKREEMTKKIKKKAVFRKKIQDMT